MSLINLEEERNTFMKRLQDRYSDDDCLEDYLIEANYVFNALIAGLRKFEIQETAVAVNLAHMRGISVTKVNRPNEVSYFLIRYTPVR